MDNIVDTDPKIETPTNRTEDTSAAINKPEPTPDVDKLFSQININDNVLDDPGASATIDCQPDFRDILYQLVDHSIRIFEQQKSRQIPALTPASLLAVFVHQINCYAALADVYYVRETMSQHAATFSQHELKKQALNRASWMNTPPFITDILQGLTPTCDPLRKNICFIFSYASFKFTTDLGRFFPLHMFLALHNIIATKGANTDSDEIWLEWLRYPVYSITDQEPITVANIIGGGYENFLTENFLTRKLKGLLNVTLSHQRLRRAIFQEFRFSKFPTIADINDYDAYTLILSAANEIISPLDTFLDIMTAQFAFIFKGCKPLGSAFELTSGTNIMNHYYDEYQPPTFHRLKVDLKQKSSVKCQSTTNFLQAIKYRCTYLCSDEPTIAFGLSNIVQVLNSSAALRSTLTTQPKDPDTKESSITQQLSKSPIFLYSPWSTGTSSMHYALTSGLHIETSEIDSFHVPIPRLDSTLHDENSIFLSSAIPITACFDTLNYNGEINNFTRYRSYDSDYESRNSFSMYNMSKHTIPMYCTTVGSASNKDLLPGFKLQDGITHADLASTKIAYSGEVEWTPDKIKEVFPRKPFVWSSYRWINPCFAQSDTVANNTYFIADFRALYGTAPQTFKSYHLYDLIK